MSRFNILILFIASALMMSAAPPSVIVPNQVNVGTPFHIQILVQDINAKYPANVDMPKCKLVGRPSSFPKENGLLVITYTYVALETGITTFPSIGITLDNGKTVSTDVKSVKIVDADQKTTTRDRTTAIDVKEDEVIIPTGDFSSSDVMVRIITNKSTVYEQEPVVVTIKLYSVAQMGAKFQGLLQPTFEGFLSEEINDTGQRGIETVNGRTYNTFVVKRCVLYPQKSGQLKMTSGTYEITLEDVKHYNTGALSVETRIFHRTLQTPDQTATLKVLPLPTPRPASFDGAVGNFTATATLSSNPPRTNEPLTYTIKVTGTGNIKYLKTPKLSLPDGLDQYTPKTDIDASYSGNDITGTYTATYTIVPQEVGAFEIPELDFTYFNPASKEYKTIKLKGFDLNVAKGTGGEKTEISKEMTDIHHIHQAKSPLVKTIDRTYHAWWYWMIYVILIFALVCAVAIYRRYVRLSTDVQGRRLARAARVAMKRFKTAKRLMSEHKADDFYTEINRALFGYLSAKLSIPASQLVRENIATQLTDYGLSESETANIINIIDDCEMARFTPMGSDKEMASIYDKVYQAVSSIENVKQSKK